MPVTGTRVQIPDRPAAVNLRPSLTGEGNPFFIATDAPNATGRQKGARETSQKTARTIIADDSFEDTSF